MNEARGPDSQIDVLVVTTVHWAPTTRLALAMAEAGLRVGAVAPAEHALHRMDAIAATRVCVPHSGFAAVVDRAIRDLRPATVVPGDDRAVRGLHALYTHTLRLGGTDRRLIAKTIRRSLGNPSSFPVVALKSRFAAFCIEEGLPDPETVVVQSRSQFHALLEMRGLPQVLKLDGLWGGQGVRIIRSQAEGARAFADLSAWRKWRSVARRMLEEVSTAPLLDTIGRHGPAVTMQRYVDGTPANRAVFCRDGAVMAGTTVMALALSGPTAPTTVVRVIHDAEIEAVTRRIVRKLGLSGFIGLDFVIEAETGKPWLLEINPRPTQICHLALGAGSDMIGALAASLTSGPSRVAAAATDQDVIALYPQEMWRDPTSAYLHRAYHDVPWQWPQFIEAYARPVRADPESWVQTLARRMRFRALRRRIPVLDLDHAATIDAAALTSAPQSRMVGP